MRSLDMVDRAFLYSQKKTGCVTKATICLLRLPVAAAYDTPAGLKGMHAQAQYRLQQNANRRAWGFFSRSTQQMFPRRACCLDGCHAQYKLSANQVRTRKNMVPPLGAALTECYEKDMLL